MIFGTVTATAQQKLTADAGKSKLQWLGEKVTGEHTGTINLKEGWLNWKDNRILSGEFDINFSQNIRGETIIMLFTLCNSRSSLSPVIKISAFPFKADESITTSSLT